MPNIVAEICGMDFTEGGGYAGGGAFFFVSICGRDLYTWSVVDGDGETILTCQVGCETLTKEQAIVDMAYAYFWLGEAENCNCRGQ